MILFYFNACTVHKTSLLQSYKQTINYLRFAFIGYYFSDRIIVLSSCDSDSKVLGLEHSPAFRVRNHCLPMLARSRNRGLIFVKPMEMGRDRERIIHKRVAVIIETGNSQNKPLITRASTPDILPAYSRSPFILSLINEGILNLTFGSNSTLLVALYMIFQLAIVPGDVPMMGTGEPRTRNLLCTSAGLYHFEPFG